MSKPDQILDSLVAAAISWWRGHRPIEWTEVEHRGNPTVNCASNKERELARVVAEYVSLTKRGARP